MENEGEVHVDGQGEGAEWREDDEERDGEKVRENRKVRGGKYVYDDAILPDL